MEISTLTANPFENHLVIEKVLQHAHFEELKSLRQVNSFWNEFASPLVEQKAWIHLNSSNIDDFLHFQGTRIEDVNVAPVKNFRNFHLKSVSLNLEDPESSASKFFAQYGKNIEEIILEKCIWTFQTDAAKLFGEYLPNCKTLSISSPTVNPGQGDEEFQLCQNWSVKYLELIPGIDNKKIAWWGQIFQMLPGLTSLNVQCRTVNDTTHMLQGLLNASPQLTNLRELSSFLTEFNDHHLGQLIHLNLPFTSLDLNLCPSVTSKSLHNMLASTKKTLKSLKLFHGMLPAGLHEFPVEFHGGFPYEVQLNELESLELIGDMISSFSFLKYAPRLNKLCILQPNNEDEPIILESLHIENTKETKDLRHCNLQFLQTLSMEYSLQPECMRKLATTIAPNFRSISLHLSDDSIRAVFRCMTNLEELIILGTEVTDEGITGIGFEDLLSTPEYDLKCLKKHRKFPYIGDCKRLRKLTLYAQPQENISDYSVHLGFMAVKELVVLDLPLTAITDVGIETLQTKSNLVQLSAKYFVEDGQAWKRAPHLQQWNYGSKLVAML